MKAGEQMISKHNAPHYKWGENCDGWRLVDKANKSIIHEHMPAGTCEARHFHNKAEQFFFVLSGIMTIELDGAKYQLSAHEGIEVPALLLHQVFNHSNSSLEFLVISQPNTRGDRIAAE